MREVEGEKGVPLLLLPPTCFARPPSPFSISKCPRLRQLNHYSTRGGPASTLASARMRARGEFIGGDVDTADILAVTAHLHTAFIYEGMRTESAAVSPGT